ncbi:MJ1255/VC2487 family glycosyltransferase [Shewanella sp. FJAT-52076]|uniref:MJ1255/VC2487 family glycosyltransferase n=1 Tax=Shewanella sp. FJAT-52076 TaxID=2864202 RepID=UPI001C661641|nr:MJ1255/VC2487 family glycosyltransferase [Shewanella sp. FJAT-52076]QYJ74947.1 glycosyltransferase [Shewanella sp. FJAT-52076]
MKILYGVQGTGNGHLSRARVMAKALAERGAEVDYLFSGRPKSQFFDMDIFGDYRVATGLTFVSKAGRISSVDTVRHNLSCRWWQDIRGLDLSSYDLVLNDFEPVSAWAARRQKVPCIGISHQAALRFDVPKVGNTWFNERLLEYFAPVDVALGCHWHHFGFPLLPPFVDVGEVSEEHGHDILVYLPFEAPGDIIDFLRPFDNYRFLVYHAQSPNGPVPEHIQWHGFCREGFRRHLAEAGGVVANAGFELASEALTLGKKLLVKPLIGQFEQLSNVAALQLLGAAHSMMHLSRDAMRSWLKSASPEPVRYPAVGDALVQWIEQGEWHRGDLLSEQLWSQVRLPDTWR